MMQSSRFSSPAFPGLAFLSFIIVSTSLCKSFLSETQSIFNAIENSAYLDQTPQNVAFDQGFYCLLSECSIKMEQ